MVLRPLVLDEQTSASLVVPLLTDSRVSDFSASIPHETIHHNAPPNRHTHKNHAQQYIYVAHWTTL